MKTFKEYIKDPLYNKNDIKNHSVIIDNEEYLFFGYDKHVPIYVNMINNIKKGNKINKQDIDLFIKNYPRKNYFRILAMLCVKYNRKIPELFLTHLRNNTPISVNMLIYDIKRLPNFKEKLPDILKRNPELLEYFI